MLRDNISWTIEEDTWKVQYDVGIKLIFCSQEVQVLAVDSLAGLLKCSIHPPKSPFNISKELQNYWSMKADCLIERNRAEIDIMKI